MISAPQALACLALWPLLVAGPVRVLRTVGALAAVLALGSSTLSALLPALTPDEPAWSNLRYILDVDAQRARWELSTFGARVPPALAQAAPFEPATTAPFPWLSLDPSMQVAPAPIWNVAAPSIEVMASVRSAEGRDVRARLRSERGATRLHLRLPPNVTLRAVRSAGHELAGGFDGLRTQLFFAVPSEGLEVDLQVQGDAAARLWLLDQDWTLPDESAPLQRARPATYVPRSDGDVSVVGRSFEL